MGNHTLNKAKQLPVVYFQNILCQSVFCRIINAFPYVLKDVDTIVLVFNQLELTDFVNFRFKFAI